MLERVSFWLAWALFLGNVAVKAAKVPAEGTGEAVVVILTSFWPVVAVSALLVALLWLVPVARTALTVILVVASVLTVDLLITLDAYRGADS
ncbi:MAG: hypothetical protein AAF430_18040 [Myxococcota bacterium]